jgi:RNA polymerase sigma-70 factor, ECF subfamily
VSKFLRAFAPTFWPGTALTWIEANGAPSVRISRDGTVVALLAISASVDGIEQLMWVLSPDKLSGVSDT